MSHVEVTKIKIRIGEKEHELTLDEARQVKAALQNVLDPPAVVPPITYPWRPWWYPWRDATEVPAYKLTWISSNGDSGSHQLVNMNEGSNG